MIHFSVFLLTYNRPNLLMHTIKSLELQTYKNFKIYLVDNGSQPPVKSSNLPGNLDIEFTRIDRNQRHCAPHNAVIEQIQGTHFLWLADDDVLIPAALEIIAGYFENHPEIEALSTGFSRFDHETCNPLSGRNYFGLFSGNLHRLNGFRSGLEYCKNWGIGRQAFNGSYVPRLAHSSATIFSVGLIKRTIARQRELFVNPLGDVGFLGCNFNSKFIHYLDVPLVVLGESNKKDLDGVKSGNRHHWRELLRYLEYSPLKGCSFVNIGLEAHLQVLYRNGINNFVDMKIRYDFFLRHIREILSDDPWNDETDRDLKEAIPFAIQSLVEQRALSKKVAHSALGEWVNEQSKQIEMEKKAMEDQLSLDNFEKRSNIFRDINEFAAWQERSVVKPRLKSYQYEFPKSSNDNKNPTVNTHEKNYEIPISLMITVYNEEERIPYVLASSFEWANEIVVFNKSSTDKTKEICLSFGEKVKVVDVPFSPAGHNDTISEVKVPKNNWIFVGTASEIPTRNLIKQIKQVLHNYDGSLDLIYIPRKYYSFGIHDKRSPWSISYFPFMINRNKAIISNEIHKNFRPTDPNNTVKIEFSDDCCVYHLTHPTAKNYLHGMTDYFEIEAGACKNPPAKIQECMANIAKFEERLRSGGNDLIGHYFAWQIYWLGTALFVWEKWRGINVKRFYKELRRNIFEEEWLQNKNEYSVFLSEKVSKPEAPEKKPIVSAIVSTFNSERFIRGCLEDLESQTISDRLEIIVIDSASEQNEKAIVKEFQAKYSNIKYIKTEQRETVYAAWNRGIKAASGKYITNANTDDRHLPYAFERMVHVLENTPDISLVYADVWITQNENETHRNFTAIGTYCWKEFDPMTLVDGCYIGPQPMWRKDIHEEYGYFDETFHSAGDWEFWLRISETRKFLHLNEFLGLYLKSPTSVEHRNRQLSIEEEKHIRHRYALKKVGTAKDAKGSYHNALALLFDGKSEEAKVALLGLVESFPDFAPAYNDLGVLFLNRNDTNNALKYYQKAFDLEPENATFAKNLADFYFVKAGRVQEALQLYTKLLEKDPADIEILLIMAQVCESFEKTEDARGFYKRVLALEPRNRAALKKMEELAANSDMDFGNDIARQETHSDSCYSWRENSAVS